MMTTDERAARLACLRTDERPALIGLGAIGSWVARWLSANGIDFVGYDDDIVAYKNLAAGAFTVRDVGLRKSTSLGCGVTHRWTVDDVLGTTVLVCADHGPTRRAAARRAQDCGTDFICAKANGSLWQVWHVPQSSSPDDFIAFDDAAEANPVMVRCGDPSVGRIASLGAAAEMLTLWTGLEVTTAEVEASFGIAYDPAIVHVLTTGWEVRREYAEKTAQEEAEKAFKQAIDRERSASDEIAVAQLEGLRSRRLRRQRMVRSTMHQRAIVMLDDDHSTRYAAETARVSTGFATHVLAESRILAGLTARECSVPETVVIEEVSA